MAGRVDENELYVEGKDDLYSIGSLLERCGIRRGVGPNAAIIKEAKTVQNLLRTIEYEIGQRRRRVLGFVLDADESPHDRWRAVSDRLERGRLTSIPELPPESGFIGYSEEFKTKVGVWMMPDNGSSGMLEDFLFRLIQEDDPLFRHTQEATDEASRLGATFPERWRSAAVVGAWLAWQDTPGRTHGDAMKAKSFRHDAPLAARFVAWYSELFGIEIAPRVNA